MARPRTTEDRQLMLLTPLKVGNVELKNRMAVPPMLTSYCDWDGMPTEQYIAYHEAKARGGFGLIITEDYAIDPTGRAGSTAGLWKDEQIEPHAELVQRVHAAGAKIFAQIYHAGRETASVVIGAQPVSASALECPLMGEIPHELSIPEVEQVISQFGDTALRAKKAGFDGIELHGAHGYLLAQFMSHYSNKRTDQYGGSFANRMRFPLEVIADIHAKCGYDFPISYRISGDELVTGGRQIEETAAICRILEDAGVDLLHVSVGVYESAWSTIAPLYVPQGWLVPAAARIKQAVDIPVQVVSRITQPEMAESILQAGHADLISFGRASIADPDFAIKVAQGRQDEIRHCIGCNQGCAGAATSSVRCLINPQIGFEASDELQPTGQPRKVMVIGGGPAGLEAARGAQLVGHDVTVYEKTSRLGGNFQVGAVPPAKGELTSYITWLDEELARMNVPIHLNAEVDAALVGQEQPDVVIYAGGAVHDLPPIPGIDGANVVTACDVLENKVGTGKRVVVCGAGMIGSETASYLGTLGRQVTLVDELPEVATEEVSARRHFLLQMLEKYKIRTVLNARIEGFSELGVTVNQDGKSREIQCDTIVLALGMKPDTGLVEQLKGLAEVRVIGDAEGASDALKASRQGYLTGITL